MPDYLHDDWLFGSMLESTLSSIEISTYFPFLPISPVFAPRHSKRADCYIEARRHRPHVCDRRSSECWPPSHHPTKSFRRAPPHTPSLTVFLFSSSSLLLFSSSISIPLRYSPNGSTTFGRAALEEPCAFHHFHRDAEPRPQVVLGTHIKMVGNGDGAASDAKLGWC